VFGPAETKIREVLGRMPVDEEGDAREDGQAVEDINAIITSHLEHS
jgi:hypothetical protein